MASQSRPPVVEPIARPSSPPPAPLLTLAELAENLRLSQSQIERLVAQGLPALDVSIPRPGRRSKRCLRFSPSEVIEWLRARRGGDA